MQEDQQNADNQPAWQYTPGDADQAGSFASDNSQPSPDPIEWTASEFIAHQKTSGWYVLFVLSGIAIAALIYLLTRDFISAGVIVFIAIMMAVFAARKPRTLHYRLDDYGVHIGEKSYPYSLFKSFSVIDEGAVSSINFMPLKRFMPSISMYYDPKDEDNITQILGAYLPFEHGELDPIDNFMRKIRF